MKKLIMATTLLFLMCSMVFAQRSWNVHEDISSFLKTHFPNNHISYVQNEWDGTEVTLKGHVKIEFTSSNVWKDIECPDGIPHSVLPEAVRDNLNRIKPNALIVEVERNRKGLYEIKVGRTRPTTFTFKEDGTQIRYNF